MKKNLSTGMLLFLIFVCMFFSSCSPEKQFTISNDGVITSPDGTEYVFLANEGIVCHFGEINLIGKIKGEKPDFMSLR